MYHILYVHLRNTEMNKIYKSIESSKNEKNNYESHPN